jgi:hypothetical protein
MRRYVFSVCGEMRWAPILGSESMGQHIKDGVTVSPSFILACRMVTGDDSPETVRAVFRSPELLQKVFALAGDIVMAAEGLVSKQ